MSANGNTKVTRKNRYWRKAISIFGIFAEIANVGILVEIVAKWVPRFAILATAPFMVYLMAIADPLIYFFRALIRLTRVIGRTFFNVTFAEEKHGTHPYQTAGDILSLLLFGLAILMFTGLIVAGPVGLTLAWTFGLIGLIPIGFFDYAWPEQKAKERYDALIKDKQADPDERDRAHKEYIELRSSKRLFIALLLGLSLLLICGSAAAFAPPLLVPVLAITSKIASIYLGGIAVGRFLSWLFKNEDHHEPRKAAEPTPAPSPAPTPTNSPSPKSGLQNNKLASPPHVGSNNQGVKIDADSVEESLPSRDGLFSKTAKAVSSSAPEPAPEPLLAFQP